MSLKVNEAFALEIGGLRISIRCGRDSARTALEKNQSAAAGDILFRLHCGGLPQVEQKEGIFDSGSGWSLFRAGDRGGCCLQNGTLQPDSMPDTMIFLDADLRGGDIHLQDAEPDPAIFPDLFGYPLNQIMMILLLSARNGVVIHACGIRDGRRGYLFAGNSTNGKSTLAKIWHKRGATILNDDRIIVREQEGAFRMYGTPWHGTYDRTSLESLPVEKIFFLKHGRENLLVPKAGAEAVSMLLTRAFPPFWDRCGMQRVLELFDRMTNALPCRELSFLPDGRVIDFIRNMDQR